MHPERKPSRSALLAGTSLIALMLVGGDGALARPFGQRGNGFGDQRSPAIRRLRRRSRRLPSQNKARAHWRARARRSRPYRRCKQRPAARPRRPERPGRCRRLWCRTGWRRAGCRWRRARRQGRRCGRALICRPSRPAAARPVSPSTQTAAQAILNWQTFNVGTPDHGQFQPAGQHLDRAQPRDRQSRPEPDSRPHQRCRARSW